MWFALITIGVMHISWTHRPPTFLCSPMIAVIAVIQSSCRLGAPRLETIRVSECCGRSPLGHKRIPVIRDVDGCGGEGSEVETYEWVIGWGQRSDRNLLNTYDKISGISQRWI